MKISSDFVGMELKEFSACAEKRHTTNYAAAVSDYNPFYFNDEDEEKMLAHPMFAVALSWPLIANIGEYADFNEAVTLLLSIVHYSEFIRFHRPVKPGETLRAKGRVAAILPRRGGTYIVFEIPFRDKKENPVFTEYIGGLLRGVECSDSGRGAGNLPEVPEIGGPQNEENGLSPLWEVDELISPGAPYIYDACSDIVFAIHTSPAFARYVGLPGIILQGTATLARAVRELINHEAEGNPRRLAEINCRFRAMISPGETIKIRLLERRDKGNDKELFFDVLNGKNEKAIKDGFALIKA